MNWPSTVLSASGLISPRLSFPKAPWSLPFVNIFEQQQLKTEFLRGWASSEVPGPVLIVEFHFSSLEGLMVKLKLQYFGHIMAKWEELTHLRRPRCWERLRAGGEGDDRGWDGWMASPTPWTWVWVDSGSWWWTEAWRACSSWGRKESDTTVRLNWTEWNRQTQMEDLLCIK